MASPDYDVTVTREDNLWVAVAHGNLSQCAIADLLGLSHQRVNQLINS
ncbi:hypothetical protein [Amycolatopsis alkalitolerans]|nr:hypothetical protein [Amycolatopsis alkalitolerans]